MGLSYRWIDSVFSRPRFDIWQARPTASAILVLGYNCFTSLQVAKLDPLGTRACGQRGSGGGFVRAVCTRLVRGQGPFVAKVSDNGLKPAAAFVVRASLWVHRGSDKPQNLYRVFQSLVEFLRMFCPTCGVRGLLFTSLPSHCALWCARLILFQCSVLFA